MQIPSQIASKIGPKSMKIQWNNGFVIMLPTFIEKYWKTQLFPKVQCASSVVNSSQNRCLQNIHPKTYQKSMKITNKVVPEAYPKQGQKIITTFCETCLPKGLPGIQNRAQILPQTLLEASLGSHWHPRGAPRLPQGSQGGHQTPKSIKIT